MAGAAGKKADTPDLVYGLEDKPPFGNALFGDAVYPVGEFLVRYRHDRARRGDERGWIDQGCDDFDAVGRIVCRRIFGMFLGVASAVFEKSDYADGQRRGRDADWLEFGTRRYYRFRRRLRRESGQHVRLDGKLGAGVAGVVDRVDIQLHEKPAAAHERYCGRVDCRLYRRAVFGQGGFFRAAKPAAGYAARTV